MSVHLSRFCLIAETSTLRPTEVLQPVPVPEGDLRVVSNDNRKVPAQLHHPLVTPFKTNTLFNSSYEPYAQSLLDNARHLERDGPRPEQWRGEAGVGKASPPSLPPSLAPSLPPSLPPSLLPSLPSPTHSPQNRQACMYMTPLPHLPTALTYRGSGELAERGGGGQRSWQRGAPG